MNLERSANASRVAGAPGLLAETPPVTVDSPPFGFAEAGDGVRVHVLEHLC